MSRILLSVVSLVFLIGVFAFQFRQKVSSQSGSGRVVSNANYMGNRPINSNVSSIKGLSNIRHVDFKNFNVGWCGGDLFLRNGHAKYGDSDYDTADLKPVKYVDFNGDGKEEAFVSVDWTTSGSSGGGMNAYVFMLQNGTPVEIWSKCNERSGFVLRGKSIFYNYPEYLGDDAHCCPTFMTTDTYTWKGSDIVRIAKKRKRSTYR
ncbi:MAG: hypothetical protein H7070_10705 [Saprospiraceae bacterium]|nr:hypothetical protein [Pyrinomonadaceae bacterium]